MWFLTAWIARLVDYRSGWDLKRVMLVAPYLVTLVTFATFLRHLPKSHRQGGLPFILAFTGIFYAFLIGIIKTSPLTAARSLLDWLTPLLFGFHLFVNWRDYPSYRQNIQRTFLWGVLVMGIYGVVQYVVAPEWDRFWIINTKLTSIGRPEPFGIRVYSTMHSCVPFCAAMLAGLLLLFNSQDTLRIPAAVAGYLSFLLTLVRTAWGGWIVGLLTLVSSLKPNLQMRLIITILVMAVFVFPLTTIEPFSEIINARFQSFSNVNEDDSFNARASIYEGQLGIAFSQVLGSGIGGTWIVKDNGKLESIVFDSGILDMFFTLGWFGAISHLGGIFLLLFKLFQNSESRADPFASASRAISLAIFAQMPLSSTTIAFNGLIFWGFAGLALAADKYHQHQRITRLRGG
jgi:hypothetical protein